MNSFFISCIATGFVSFLIGLFVFFKNWRGSINIRWALFCFSVGVWSIGLGMMTSSLDVSSAKFWIKIHYFGAILIAPCFMDFVSVLIKDNQKRNLYLGYLIAGLLEVLNVSGKLAFPEPLYPFNFYTKPYKPYLIFVAFFLIVITHSLYRLLIAYKESTGTTRTQFKQLFTGLLIGFAGGSTSFFPVFNWPLFPYGIYFVSVYTIIVAYIIIQHKFLDIHTVIHKTIMWIVISSLVLVPVIIVFYFGRTWLNQLSNLQWSFFVAVLFVMALPYFKFIQPKIDHLFQRRKYDMQKILQGLVRELTALKNLDRLIEKIASTIQEALYVSNMTLIIWDDKNRNYKIVGKDENLNLDDPCIVCLKDQNGVIERDEVEQNPKYESIRPLALFYFKKFNARVILPLIHDGKLVGVVNLGEKDNLKSFSKMDIDFLSNLKTQASIALSNSLLYDNVNRMSEELKQWSFELERKVEDRTRELAESKKELEDSYSKLKELDQMKTDFFSNVNHELRTPLTLILLPLEMALNKEYGELTPELQKSLATVKTNSLRLLNLINGLLDLAKTNAGKMELFKSKSDLSVLVQSIISSLSLVADRKNIQISFNAKTAIPEFYFDREKIERVFINVISNALKFTDPEGSIEVILESKEGVVEARIKDTGIGIPKTALEKIFERFTQVDSTSSRKYQGTGLGLALCKNFLELHGGHIRAESELGKGTTFILSLPLLLSVEEGLDPVDRRVKELETKVKRRNDDLTKKLSVAALYESTDLESPYNYHKEVRTHAESGEAKYKILVVEDHSQMRDYIRSILKREYTVITAQNGVEGLEKVKTDFPDLIVSDLMMPLKDGYQLCKELKTAPESRHIPIILLTAKSDLTNKIEGLELGANEYLSKPFNAAELMARVKSLLLLKELEKENAQSKKMAAMAVMVAGVIHEINNPISFTRTSWTTISESFERLKEMIQVPELKNKQEEISELVYSTDMALDIVHKGIERIQTVINRLRVFDGRQSLQFESIQMSQLLDQLVGRMEEGFTDTQKEQIRIDKEYQLHEPVEGISVLLTQTFEVLIDNAIKATRGTGLIKIKTWQGGEGKVFISVKDHGCGIKKEKLAHLFEPFFTLRDVGSGMGLGLFLVHQVIQAHHGSVTVNSIENEGTEIIIQLPVIQPQISLFTRQSQQTLY